MPRFAKQNGAVFDPADVLERAQHENTANGYRPELEWASDIGILEEDHIAVMMPFSRRLSSIEEHAVGVNNGVRRRIR